MDITSIFGLSSLYNTSAVGNNTQATETSTQEIARRISESEDSVSFSTEGLRRSKMPPPPMDIDFASMSDEDLTSFLQEMEETRGMVPGLEPGTSVADLTSEQLQSVRETLTEMTTRMQEMAQQRMEEMPQQRMQEMAQQRPKEPSADRMPPWAIHSYQSNDTTLL